MPEQVFPAQDDAQLRGVDSRPHGFRLGDAAGIRIIERGTKLDSDAVAPVVTIHSAFCARSISISVRVLSACVQRAWRSTTLRDTPTARLVPATSTRRCSPGATPGARSSRIARAGRATIVCAPPP